MVAAFGNIIPKIGLKKVRTDTVMIAIDLNDRASAGGIYFIKQFTNV